jgi:hypothetical protein
MADTNILVTSATAVGGVQQIVHKATTDFAGGGCLTYLALIGIEVWSAASNNRAAASKVGEITPGRTVRPDRPWPQCDALVLVSRPRRLGQPWRLLARLGDRRHRRHHEQSGPASRERRAGADGVELRDAFGPVGQSRHDHRRLVAGRHPSRAAPSRAIRSARQTAAGASK